jgi:hypothetical protein
MEMQEQQLARALIHRRDHGCAIKSLFVRRRVYYILVLVAAFALLVLACGLQWENPVLFPAIAGGFLLAVPLRDLVWMQQIKASWRFTERVVDWAEVERIAHGEARANNTPELTSGGRADASPGGNST